MVVENILREKGLLLSGSKSYARFFQDPGQCLAGNMKCYDSASSYAAQRMLMDLPTPSKPRRDTSSAQVSAAINNGNGILKKSTSSFNVKWEENTFDLKRGFVCNYSKIYPAC